jgi:hypothetical protein
VSRETDIIIVANAFRVWTRKSMPGWEGGMLGYQSSTHTGSDGSYSRSHRCAWCVGATEWVDASVPLQHSYDCPKEAAKRLLNRIEGK